MRGKINRCSLLLVVPALVLVAGMVMSAQAQPVFKPVPSDQVNKAELEKARRIADTTLSNWRDGKFEPRSDEFTEAMKTASTPDRQKMSYEAIKDMFGDYRSLDYVEAVTSKDVPGLIVYRFRGTFSGSDTKPEIRVVMNREGKVAGFWIKPWSAQLK